MAWLLLPLGIYWVLFDRFLVYAGYPWLLGGRAFLGIMAVTGALGFAFPRVIPDLIGMIWDGIMSVLRRWWWWF